MIFMELKDLLADEQFISEIIPLDSLEEVQAAFKEKGVKISIEECQEIGKAIRRIIAVTDDETENISGGGDDDIGAVSDYLNKLRQDRINGDKKEQRKQPESKSKKKTGKHLLSLHRANHNQAERPKRLSAR